MLLQRLKDMKTPSRQKMTGQTKTRGPKIYACKTLMSSFGLNITDFIKEFIF